MFILPVTTHFTLGTYVVRDLSATPQCRPVPVGKSYANNPINIELVETFEKGIIPNLQIPDATVYTIEYKFSRIGRKWYYETEAERDTEYDLLISEKV